MVELRGRSERRNGAPLPPAPDLDPAGAVKAAEADEVGEEEGVAAERQRGGRESAAAGRGERPSGRRVTRGGSVGRRLAARGVCLRPPQARSWWRQRHPALN